jgi:kynurenine formamidase
VILPDYDDLPINPAGGRTAWRLFGDDDSVGMINLQTPERVAGAAALARKGSVFSLNVSFDLFSPALAPGRGTARHFVDVIRLPFAKGCDDVYDNFYPQANSQWDSLAHASFNTEEFYNGVREEQIVAGERNTIEHWAQRGIAGRAVLLDLTAADEPYNPGSSHAFTVEDLEHARIRSGVEYQPGDTLLLHTGYAKWYSEQSAAIKAAIPGNLEAAGLEHSEQMCRYLWNAHPAAIACDTFAVEVWPPSFDPALSPFGFIHQMLIGGFGFALGELWWLADLAADCRSDGVYECLLVSAPLNLPGGIGSTANAIAIK